ncbi:MAG: hypothetical protein WC385_00590 [Candidatus Paceibacterota bacterium]|jgi:hypothetical protein
MSFEQQIGISKKDDINPIPDFELGDLRPTKDFGGSSMIHNLGDGYVVKEQLSDIAKQVVGPAAELSKSVNRRAIDFAEQTCQPEQIETIRLQLEKRLELLNNNLSLCLQYLGDYFLDGRYQIKRNKNGIPTIYFTQERFPQDGVTLNPDSWALVFDDIVRGRLRDFIARIEKMYEETGLMVDLLTLDNVAFSPAQKTFYLYDADPLICSNDRREELEVKYLVSSENSRSFKTYHGTDTRNDLESNFEHLEMLKELVVADKP